MTKNKIRQAFAFFGLLAGLTVQATASDWKDIRGGAWYALNSAGFQQSLVQDQYGWPLKGSGWTYNIGQTYNDKEYKFGNTTINLNGNVTGQFSFINRGYSSVDLSWETPGGLGYTYEAFVGDRKLHIDNGIFNTKAKININEFGMYSIELDVSNRGTLVDDGDVSYSFPLDYDLGPMNFEGQWLIDVINMTLGKQFGFTLPGGAADQIVSALFAVNQQQLQKVLAAYESQIQSGESPIPAGSSFQMVPEPVSLVPMLLGLGSLAARRRK
jgi:hypothetical protein